MDTELQDLCRRVADCLQARDLSLITAESCTGGWIAKLCTDRAGSSNWFARGYVTYSNTSKQEMLGVQTATLENQGAVSEACVREMVAGALGAQRQRLAVAVSGIAGPNGAQPGKPVGTVWFAWQGEGLPMTTCREQFDGDRDAVRRQAVQRALSGILAGCDCA